MSKTAKVFTIINYVFSAILWVHCFFILFTNIVDTGIPEIWEALGFLLLYYFLFPVFVQIISFIVALVKKDKKAILLNTISTIITVANLLFFFFVSSGSLPYLLSLG